MRTLSFPLSKLCLALLTLAGAPARAQEFPTNAEDWLPLWCGRDVSSDGFQDESGATAERDLVGDAARPTAARAADDKYLYLRLRLDEATTSGGRFRPFSWGVLLDTDRDPSTYEVLIRLDGNADKVSLFENTVTTLADDPADPPDEPALKTWPASTHARNVLAGGAGFGPGADAWLELAVPWDELASVRVFPWTPVLAWAATSTTSTALNGDLACWDDRGGPGALSRGGSERRVLSPDGDSDGDGFSDRSEVANGTDPGDPASRPAGSPDALSLAGGGGCQVGLPGTLALLGLAGLLRRRRRCSASG